MGSLIMSDLASKSTQTLEDAVRIIEAYLDASMIPDPVTAGQYIAPDLIFTFTGGRRFDHPRDAAAFNAKRYQWVKKKRERSDASQSGNDIIVYNIGTLYGAWPDGTSFEGNRYVDRFVIRNGLIVKMDVWNDSAERLLVRHDIDA